ncbi:MAG: ribonuclease III [Bacillota bacterium]
MVLKSNKESLIKLEDKLNIEFNNKTLIQKAVTHKSFPNENLELDLEDNERLEFLGDAVLNLAISSYVYRHFPQYPEGKLAKMKSVLVSERMLAQKAKKLEIGEHLLLGKGEEATGGRKRNSILADTMEAIFGAIYLEKDFEFVKNFIQNLFKKNIKAVNNNNYIRDYKTLLQELVQKDGSKRPQYEVIEETGPEHNKEFLIEVKVNDKKLGKGRGSNKKEAEQQAAKTALKNLDEF